LSSPEGEEDEAAGADPRTSQHCDGSKRVFGMDGRITWGHDVPVRLRQLHTMATYSSTGPQEIIGTQSPNDWRLAPHEHADNLERAAPQAASLQRILRTPEIGDIMKRYRDADALALAEQARYRRAGRLAIWSRFAALAAGGVALLPIDRLLTQSLRPYLIVVQAIALMLSLLAALWVTWRGTFSKWMHARGAAEIARVDLFDRILAAPVDGQPGELAPLRLKLEYFRRYQLEMQCAFYAGRGAQHAQAAGNTTRWKFICLALVASGAAAVLYALGLFADPSRWEHETAQKVIIAAMTLVSAVLASVSDRSLMDLNERNAARYGTTHQNLAKLRDDYLPAVREAADRGDEAAVLAFVRVVQDQISSEHREWVMIHELAPRPELELLMKLPGAKKRLAGDAKHK
jgi:hypothetical protein